MRRPVVAIVALVLLVLAGGREAGAAMVADDPVTAMRDAAWRTRAWSYGMTIGPDGDAVTFDPHGDVMVLSRREQVLAFRVGDLAYLRIEVPDEPPWLCFDLSRTTVRNEVTMAFDLTSYVAPGILTGVVAAERTRPGHYTGVIDIGSAIEGNPGLVAAFDRDAAPVAFEATLDRRGRLVWLAVDPKSMPRTEFRFSAYGERVHVPMPPDDQIRVAAETFYG